MKCKHLSRYKLPRCLASERLMHPSVLEQTVFCNGEPEKCPIYQEREATLTPRKEMGIAASEQESQKSLRLVR